MLHNYGQVGNPKTISMQEVKTDLMSPPGLPDHLGTLPSKEAYCGNIKSSETRERSWTILLWSPWGSAAATSTCLNKIYVEYRGSA